jgi:hypothetical protein
VTADTVLHLGLAVGTYGLKVIPIIMLKVGVMQSSQASCCPQRKERAVRVTLQLLMEVYTDFN